MPWMRLMFAGLLLFQLLGCQAASKKPLHKMKYGPPPPGYVRIVGEPVPNWKPSDMSIKPQDNAGNPLQWYSLGPKPILSEYWSGDDDASGRVVSIAVDPNDGSTAYAASASGGMWKTTDGGNTWTPKTDELSILNHGCVTLDPSNAQIVYLGTGEYTTSSTGDGLFRSTDGGDTFERIGTAAQVGAQCSKVAVDPTNPNIIHVTGSKGYVRSIDGGQVWQNTLTGACSDVAINPNAPSMVYVGRQNDGIYRSTNGGANFTKLTNGLATNNITRVLLSIARSNPDVLYAAFVNNNSGLRGFYKTTNGGTSWTQLVNTPNFPSPQGWYDCFVGVDPADENIVYCGGVFPSYAVAGVIKTTDGGQSWADITYGDNGTQLHPDQHTIAFGPEGEIWVGNDGGIWRSDNGGQSWINRNNKLTVTQNYTIAVHPNDPSKAMSGTQDNGSVARDLSTDRWPQIAAGDGGFLAYDFDQPSRRYTTYVGLVVYRLGPGSAFADITGPWDSDPVNFIAPLVMDPGDSATLLGGTNRIWRTTDASTNAEWQPISPTTVSGGGTINAIAVGPGAEGGGPSDNIYSGSSNGRVFFTSDAAIWNNRSAGLPGVSVSDIVVHPSDANTAYVSLYRNGAGRIYKTIDAGLTWIDKTGSLPTGVTPGAIVIRWTVDPPEMYIGAGSGVWFSQDDGVTWMKDGPDLPNVNIGDLYLDPDRLELTAGTYGRGAWRTSLPDPCPGPIILDQPQAQDGCLGGSATFTVTVNGNGPITYQWHKDGEDIPGATDAVYVVDPVTGGATYDVVVSNACHSRTSDPAALTVLEPPAFTLVPTAGTLCTGDTLFTFVGVTKGASLQWYLDGAAIPGATSTFLIVVHAYPCLSGLLTVTATNLCGSVETDPVDLIVEACGAGDADADGDVDLVDFSRFQLCFTGQGQSATEECRPFDFDQDADIDLTDWCSFHEITTGPMAFRAPSASAGSQAEGAPPGSMTRRSRVSEPGS